MGNFKKRKNIRLETLAVAGAILWLVVISVLRFSLPGASHQETRVKVGFLPITCHLLLPVAMEREEFFKKHVLPVKYTSWPDMIESVKGGELDAALILAPIAISMMDQGVPVEIALLGHRNGTGLVVSSKRPVNQVKEFEGKTVAIPIRYSTQNLALLSLLEKNRVDLQRVNRVELPPPDMPSALASGAIDGYIVGEPYATQARLMEAGKIFRNISSIWPGFISSVLIVRKDALKKNPGLMDSLIKGLYRQGQWIEDNRKPAADMGARFFGLSEKLIETVLLARHVSYKNILPRKEEFQDIGRKMVRYGLLKRVPQIGIYEKWH